MNAAMALHVALSMRLDAIEAYRLAHAYRAEVLTDAKNETVAWLLKKGREQATWDAGVLASKVDRGAVRVFLGTGHYRDAMDAHRAEVLAADGQAYDGQLPMLTGLVATLRAVAEHGDLDDVRKLLAEYASDDAEARKNSSDTDFFQPGHTYTRPEHHLSGPDGEPFTWTFLVSSTDTSPDGERTAHGHRTHNTTTRWEPHSVSELAWTQDGWTDVTDGGDR